MTNAAKRDDRDKREAANDAWVLTFINSKREGCATFDIPTARRRALRRLEQAKKIWYNFGRWYPTYPAEKKETRS